MLKAGQKLIALERVTGSKWVVEIVKVNKKSLRINRNLISKNGTNTRTETNYYIKRTEFDFLYANNVNVVWEA